MFFTDYVVLCHGINLSHFCSLCKCIPSGCKLETCPHLESNEPDMARRWKLLQLEIIVFSKINS